MKQKQHKDPTAAVNTPCAKIEKSGKTEQTQEKTCATCALAGDDAYICHRWRIAYRLNEIKKAVPFLRRSAVENMQCPYHWAGAGVR